MDKQDNAQIADSLISGFRTLQRLVFVGEVAHSRGRSHAVEVFAPLAKLVFLRGN